MQRNRARPIDACPGRALVIRPATAHNWALHIMAGQVKSRSGDRLPLLTLLGAICNAATPEGMVEPSSPCWVGPSGLPHAPR